MTPKEKAKELVEFFKPKVYCYAGSDYMTDTRSEEVALMYAKECALKVVEEVLELPINEWCSIAEPYQDDNYWREVKNEIEKL